MNKDKNNPNPYVGKVGDVQYGVPADQLVKKEEKRDPKTLPNKPNPSDWLSGDRVPHKSPRKIQPDTEQPNRPKIRKINVKDL